MIRYSIFFCLLVLSLGACQKKTATLLNRSTIVYKIDGQANEWSEQFIADKSFPDWTYQIAYDAQNLYVCTRTISKTIQMMLIQQGAGVYIDTSKREKNLMGLSFPLALSEAQVQQLAKVGADEKLLEKRYSDLATEFDMIGFAPEPLRASNTASKYCKAALSYDELGELVCEYQIPWKFIYQNRALRGNEVLNIHLQINELKIDDDDLQNQNPNSVINNPNGQMGGQNPMGGNPNTMNTNPFNPQAGRQMMMQSRGRPEMPSIWIKIKLN